MRNHNNNDRNNSYVDKRIMMIRWQLMIILIKIVYSLHDRSHAR